MEVLVQWFSNHLSQFISPEGAVFIISMIPILELRGGLLAASLLKISAAKHCRSVSWETLSRFRLSCFLSGRSLNG